MRSYCYRCALVFHLNSYPSSSPLEIRLPRSEKSFRRELSKMHFLLLLLLLLPLHGRLWEFDSGWREVGEDHAGEGRIGRIVYSSRLIFLLDCNSPIQPKVVKVSSSLDSSKFPIENILSAEVGTDWFAGSTGETEDFIVQVRPLSERGLRHCRLCDLHRPRLGGVQRLQAVRELPSLRPLCSLCCAPLTRIPEPSTTRFVTRPVE